MRVYAYWISVKDKLPDKTGNYLIYVNYGPDKNRTHVAIYYASERLWSPWPKENILYWMPLPDPPGEL